VAVKNIAALGAGTMGHGIAHAALTAGYDTALYDVSDAASDGKSAGASTNTDRLTARRSDYLATY